MLKVLFDMIDFPKISLKNLPMPGNQYAIHILQFSYLSRMIALNFNDLFATIS